MRLSRNWVALLLAASLAACGAPPVSVADYPSFGEIKAVFVNGRDDHVVTVRALDRLPITEATLIWGDGSDEVPAESIDSVANPTIGAYGQNDQTFTQLNGQAVAIGGAAPAPPTPGGHQSTTTLIGQTASVALIRLPELAVYREHWQEAKIRVQLGTGDEGRTETLPAPPPPKLNPT